MPHRWRHAVREAPADVPPSTGPLFALGLHQFAVNVQVGAAYHARIRREGHAGVCGGHDGAGGGVDLCGLRADARALRPEERRTDKRGSEQDAETDVVRDSLSHDVSMLHETCPQLMAAHRRASQDCRVASARWSRICSRYSGVRRAHHCNDQDAILHANSWRIALHPWAVSNRAGETSLIMS